MMATADLTAQAVLQIAQGQMPDTPVVQILGVKPISSDDPSKPVRYRLQLSDGQYKQNSAMLATQLNDLVTANKIQKFSIVKLDRYICNVVSGRRIVIILDCEVLITDYGSQIGNPEAVKDKPADGSVPTAMTTTPAPAAAAAPPAPAAAAIPKQEPKQEPRAATSAYNAAPKGGMQKSQHAMPIASLNPYNNRWCICARVTARPPIRTYNNQRGDGKLFSVDLLDETGEIRATGFNDQCDKYYNLLEQGKVFYFRGGKVKPANRRYNALKNDYEITFDHTTEITLAEEDADIPTQKFHFVPLATLEASANNAFVDVLGVCTDMGTLATIQTKTTRKDLSKRDITLMDKSEYTIQCTLWGKEAEEFDQKAEQGCILAIKAARVSDFNGKSLSVSGSSAMLVNPDLPEAHTLRGWYDAEGNNVSARKLTVQNRRGPSDSRKLLSQIKDDGLGTSEDGKPDYFSAVGTITFVRKENTVYKACSTPECNKKVIEDSDGYRCEKCNKTSPTFKYRMMLSVSVSDFTGQTWLTCFQESAEAVLGITATELGQLLDTDESQGEARVCQATFTTWNFNCRAKTEMWQDDSRVKVTCTGVSPMDYASECDYLIEKIKKYTV